jgi:hypothetical protein
VNEGESRDYPEIQIHFSVVSVHLDTSATALVLVAPKILESQVADDVRKTSAQLRDQLGQNTLESPTEPIVQVPVPPITAAESCKMQMHNTRTQRDAFGS